MARLADPVRAINSVAVVGNAVSLGGQPKKGTVLKALDSGSLEPRTMRGSASRGIGLAQSRGEERTSSEAGGDVFRFPLLSTFLFVCGLAVSCVCFGQRPPDLDRIHRKGELVVGVNAEDTPPFVYVGKGAVLTGIDIELLRLAARELGVRLRVVRTAKTFEELIQQVARGKVDLGASALFPTLSRSEMVLFSDAYWYAVPVTLVNRVEKARRRPKKSSGSSFLDDVGVRIGVFDSSGAAVAAKALFPKATLVPFRARTEMRPALLRGDLTAVYIDEIEELKWRELIPNMDLFLAVDRDESRKRDLSLAVGPKNVQLWHWLNRFIRIQEQTGTLKKLHRQFFEDRP